MKVYKTDHLPENADTCCVKTKVRELTNAQSFAINLFEMEPGGYSPLHNHPSEHRIIVLEGEGVVFDGEKALHIQSGDVIFIDASEQHQFKNVGEKPLKFLCITVNIKE